MPLLVVDNMLWVPRGSRLAVIRPDTLATDWTWKIVERDAPSTVLDYKTINLPNAQRHDFALIGTQYVLDVTYTIQILNNVSIVVETGDFQVTEAVFGPSAVTDFTAINDQLQLALGLAGANMKSTVQAWDPATGLPMDIEITVYTDETLTTILGVWRLRRRLDAVSRVVAEICYPTFLLETESGTGTGSTGTGTGA